MKRIICFWSLLILGAIAYAPLSAQQTNPSETPTPSAHSKISIGALVDTYYSYNFTNSFSQPVQYGNAGYFNPTERDYSLALAEMSLTVKQGEATAHISTIYGETADAISYSGGPTLTGQFYVWEAYGSYNPGDWTFKFGKVATHLGYEVIENNKDWDYTRSLLFSYINMPRYHVGASVNYTSPDKEWGITGYVYNGINNDNLYINQGKMYGLKLTATPESDLNFVLNGLTGPIQGYSNSLFANSYGEFIATWKTTPQFSLALDGLVNNLEPDFFLYPPTTTYWGAALYGRYLIDTDWAATARLEETENVVDYGSPIPSSHWEVREATITLEHHFSEHVLARLEARYDYALYDGKTYAPGYGPYAGGSDDQYTGTLGMVFSF